MNCYAVDIEVLRNFCSIICIGIHDENDVYEFVIFAERDDSLAIKAFFSQPDLRVITYNGKEYDNIIINRFLEDKPVTTEGLYRISKEIIEGDRKKQPRWLKNLKWSKLATYQSVDLMQVVSVNTIRPSLKGCGIHLKWPRIQDFPLPHDKPIKAEFVDKFLGYNKNDALMTRQLYLIILDDIKLREQLSEKYEVDLLSTGDSGITNVIFEKAHGIPEVKGTPRKILFVSDLMPSRYRFDTRELKEFERRLKDKKIYAPDFKFAELTVDLFGKTYRVGVGGLHSDDSSGLFKADSNTKIVDQDVASFYPAIILNEGIKPEHLDGRFFDVYRGIVNERLEGKRQGDKVKSEGLKIAINGLFGKMNFEGWWCYDPKAAFRVTIGGQIYLLDLIEKLELAGIEVISANTDGVLALVPKELEDKHKEVCQEWQQRTGFELEFTNYRLYARRDVNNYMTVGYDEKVKSKGCFYDGLLEGSKAIKKLLVTGYNAPIIALSLQSYFKNGILPEETINNETDIYNFAFGPRIGKQFDLLACSIEDGKVVYEKQQKTNRVIVVNKGVRLLKKNKQGGKDSALFKDQDVMIINDVTNPLELFDLLNRKYYINETWDIIKEIEGIKKQVSII